jgi:hypothetical protein
LNHRVEISGIREVVSSDEREIGGVGGEESDVSPAARAIEVTESEERWSRGGDDDLSIGTRIVCGLELGTEEKVDASGDRGNNAGLLRLVEIESSLVDLASSRRGVDASESHGGDGVVLKVLTNSGEVLHYGNAKALEIRSGSDSRKHEDLGRADGSSGDDDLLFGSDIVLSSGSVIEEVNSDGHAIVDDNSLSDRVVHHPEVSATENGLQV